jgi:hypothetical protein
MAHSTARQPVPDGGKQLVRRTANGVLGAVVLLLVTQAAVDTAGVDVGATGAMSPFAAGPLVGATVVAGAGAAIVYALLVEYTDQPTRNFVVAALGVFTLMLVPIFAAPPEGITTTGQAILIGYHLLVAVPLVAFVVGAIEL